MFKKKSALVPVDNHFWRLQEDLIWKDGPIFTITVPKGFVFDGASVPWFFTRLFPKSNPQYIYAACLHDYLLEYMQHKYPRSTVDEIFRRAMRFLGVPKWQMTCMYLAVCLYGLVQDGKRYYELKDHA